MDFITVLGLIAGTLTTTSFFPQLLKLKRTKSAEDISTGMFVLFCTGVVLWLIYGIVNRDIAVTVSNFVTLVLTINILFLKVKYTRESAIRSARGNLKADSVAIVPSSE